jgi:hypothetical protein
VRRGCGVVSVYFTANIMDRPSGRHRSFRRRLVRGTCTRCFTTTNDQRPTTISNFAPSVSFNVLTSNISLFVDSGSISNRITGPVSLRALDLGKMSSPSQAVPNAKRQKTAIACNPCKSKKSRCDGTRPSKSWTVFDGSLVEIDLQ